MIALEPLALRAAAIRSGKKGLSRIEQFNGAVKAVVTLDPESALATGAAVRPAPSGDRITP